MKQRFQIATSVQFYEVDQESEMFIPGSPIRLPMKRNVLYPFFVQGESEDFSDETTNII